MEATFKWSAVTAIAPVAWGTTYFVTHRFLPPDYPLYGAVLRAVPAGLLLLAVRRKLPFGSWWWRSLVLGTLNMGAFFSLIYVAAQLLPTSLASTVMASSPIAMMFFAWLLLGERPAHFSLAGAGIGLAGVCLMLLSAVSGIDVVGVAASVAAMGMSSIGYVLAKKWGQSQAGAVGRPDVRIDVLSLTSWQLLGGGLVLIPVAIAVEGAPPSLGGQELAAFAYVSVVATAIAFVAWFAGLRHLDAGTVGLVGLLNPVTGVLLGLALAGDTLGGRQVLGLGLVLLGILLGQPAVARLLRTPASRLLLDTKCRSIMRTYVRVRNRQHPARGSRRLLRLGRATGQPGAAGQTRDRGHGVGTRR